ncbi:MAG TPA: DNA polymerase III subunit gamma/tau [Candidatus Onthoplasma faecipullorum]|nr:DNA polymerase III subunit gamma/tau [Candidatus Onthoplasma faecipullorum]
MNYALYREFRPRNFDEIIGQDYIVKTLKNQIKTDRLTHAYLFCGPRGTGKTSTAKIFAKAVNCTHSVDGNPCEMCAECVALSEPNTDIIEIDAASNNRVEEIRDLREKVQFPPLIGKYKVYIVDEVHMLTDSAFNALLKTLEEPPKHVIFILATTEIHKLPATIMSRCTRFDFKLLPLQTLVEHLKYVFDKKNIKYDEKSLYLIAKAGEGSVRDMLSIADSVASFCDYNINYKDAESVIGLSNQDAIKNILISIANQDIKSLFVSIKSALESGKNIQVLCKELSDFIKNIIMVKSGINDCTILDVLPEEFATYVEIGEKFSLNFLKSAFSKFAEIELDLKYSINPENLFESACLSLFDLKSEGETNNQATKQVNTQENIKNNENLTKTSEKNVELGGKIEKNENILTNSQKNENQTKIEKVWGNVLLKVKERNMFALSNALTTVNKVEQLSNKLIIKTNDSTSFDLIDNPERISVILNLVKLFDDSIEEVIVEYDNLNASKQDIRDNLKQVFKNKIKFKE